MTKNLKRALLGSATAVALLGGVVAAVQADHHVVTELHFLVPGGAGGGWDGTARGTGEALTGAGLLEQASCLAAAAAWRLPTSSKQLTSKKAR